MTVLDPGHSYRLRVYDKKPTPYLNMTQAIVFMKREGPDYPGNKGSYPGTNLQEVVRVLIHRIYYLDNQISAWTNLICIFYLRVVLTALEWRAAKRHKVPFMLRFRVFTKIYWRIEDILTCPTCGHVPFCTMKYAYKVCKPCADHS